MLQLDISNVFSQYLCFILLMLYGFLLLFNNVTVSSLYILFLITLFSMYVQFFSFSYLFFSIFALFTCVFFWATSNNNTHTKSLRLLNQEMYFYVCAFFVEHTDTGTLDEQNGKKNRGSDGDVLVHVLIT